MNKQIFIDICTRLETQVPELRWIDWDEGQLDMQVERPAVAFPACLLDIVYAGCDDLTDTIQLVRANIPLRVAFMPSGATNTKSGVRNLAMATFAILDKIHEALQGWHNEGSFTILTRTSATRERRRDGLKVYRLNYSTTFQDVI
jgi:hypothetical protein